MSLAEIRFYGLIYVDRERNRDFNLWQRHRDPIEIYTFCAALAANSAKANGIRFGLLTNNAIEIRRLLDRSGLDHFPIEEIRFSLNVPPVRKFYSAHFKIDAIKALASGEFGDHAGLMDVDALFLRELPPDLKEMAQLGLCAFETNEVYESHGRKGILRNLETVAGTKLPEPKWYGGEFLYGSAANLRELSLEIETCWPRYVENIRSMRHVGDEMPVSAALNNLGRRGMAISDFGASRKGVVRWWSRNTNFRQVSLEEMLPYSLLHLPSDKEFLAEQARRDFALETFMDAYRSYASGKIARLRRQLFFDLWSFWPQMARESSSLRARS